MTLTPRPGFNWQAVSWGGPDERVAEDCSYCDAPIPEDSVPLILWNGDGWCARFCDACQERWWGMTKVEPFDDDYGDEGEWTSVPEMPVLGTCCICEGERATTIIMLPVKNVVRGHGWGCLVCDLPPDGASAVICEDCLSGWESNEKPLRFACRGYPAEDGRVAIEALREPHEHDPGVPH